MIGGRRRGGGARVGMRLGGCRGLRLLGFDLDAGLDVSVRVGGG